MYFIDYIGQHVLLYSEREWISWNATLHTDHYKVYFSKEHPIPWRDWIGCKRPSILLDATLKLLSKLCTVLVSVTSNEKLFSSRLSSWGSGDFSCSFPWPSFECRSDIFHHFVRSISQNYHSTESHRQREGCPEEDHKLPLRTAHRCLWIGCWQCVYLSVKWRRRNRLNFLSPSSEAGRHAGWVAGLCCLRLLGLAALLSECNFFLCNY